MSQNNYSGYGVQKGQYGQQNQQGYNPQQQGSFQQGGYNPQQQQQGSFQQGGYNPQQNQQQQYQPQQQYGGYGVQQQQYKPQQQYGGYGVQQGSFQQQQQYNPNQQQGSFQQGGYNPQQNQQQQYQPQQQYGGYGVQQQQYDPKLVQWFQAVDTDNSGAIDSTELKKALSYGGLEFSYEASLLLIKMFDKGKSGNITLSEFSALFTYLGKMKMAFKQVDQDGSGTLDQQEVLKALMTAGYQVDQKVYSVIFKKFDRKNKGEINFDGYIELCVFLGTCRNIFQKYDSYGNGKITLDLNSFLDVASFIYP
eukprot:gene1025-9929_t